MITPRQLQRLAEEKTAADPALVRSLLAGGAGAVAGAVPAALLMRAHDEATRERTRNTAFGAGLATGTVAPDLIRGLHALAQGGSL